jgi:hypothetical protein
MFNRYLEMLAMEHDDDDDAHMSRIPYRMFLTSNEHIWYALSNDIHGMLMGT